ncbi:MAG: DUF6671 family protein [Acidimicrobiales bacterium]
MTGYESSPRRAVLGTKHGKEQQIAPPLRACGIELELVSFDTDRFGTFSGEIARAKDPRATALAKAEAALKLKPAALGIASEGTFMPHPGVPFVTMDVELLVAIDRDWGVVHEVEAVDDAPYVLRMSFDHHAPPPDLARRLTEVGFPAQAMIVRAEDPSAGPIRKGIRDRDALARAVHEVVDEAGVSVVVVESDLRAHCSPGRQRAIVRAAELLAARLDQTCANCGCPGYGELGIERGLPCEYCDAPTPLPAFRRDGCRACGVSELHSLGTSADPRYCEFCNP